MAPHPWPIFDLRIRTPRLELRLPTDDDILELLRRVDEGVHPNDEMPFAMAWTRTPLPQRTYDSMQYWWGTRANWKPETWDLPLAVEHEGTLVGVQNILARDFSRRRVFETGSWLAMPYQRRGIGTEMREAVLHFGFATLGAVMGKSGNVEGNIPSARISQKLGYVPDGVDVVVPDDSAVRVQMTRIEREVWEAREHPPVTVEGFDRCRELFLGSDA